MDTAINSLDAAVGGAVDTLTDDVIEAVNETVKTIKDGDSTLATLAEHIKLDHDMHMLMLKEFVDRIKHIQATTLEVEN